MKVVFESPFGDFIRYMASAPLEYRLPIPKQVEAVVNPEVPLAPDRTLVLVFTREAPGYYKYKTWEFI